jgi:hypothetical protein
MDTGVLLMKTGKLEGVDSHATTENSVAQDSTENLATDGDHRAPPGESDKAWRRANGKPPTTARVSGDRTGESYPRNGG